MINQYLAQEQEQRYSQALDERDTNAERHCEYEALGRFDGRIGNQPDKLLVAEQWYWQGYQAGLLEYWMSTYGIEIEHEF
jgi:hypothetical protein